MSDNINAAAEQIVIEKIRDIQGKVEKAATAEELSKVSKEFAEFRKDNEANYTELKKVVDALNEKAGKLAMKAEDAKAKSLRDHIESAMLKDADLLKAIAEGERKHTNYRFDTKDVADMSTGNLSGQTSGVPTYMAGISSAPFVPRHFRSLVSVIPSATDNFHFVRHDETVGEGSIYWQSAENAAKNQRDYDFTDVTVNLKALAGYVKTSRQSLRNIPGLAAFLGQYLPEDYLQAEDARAYAALAAESLTTGSTAGSWDGVIATIGTLGNAKYSANGIVVRPSTISSLIQNKDDYNAYTYPGAINIAPNGALTVMGVPVYSATWVPTDKAIIGDWRQFAIVQSEALSVRSTEFDQDDFIKNRITYLVEAVVGFATFRPKAFSIIDLGFE